MLKGSPSTEKPDIIRLECPKCHRVTAATAASFPLCSRRSCSEYLTKCRYCRWYEPETVECTSPQIRARMGDITGRFVIRDIDAYINCPEHSSTIIYNPVVQARKYAFSLARVGVTVLLLCGVAYGTFLFSSTWEKKQSTVGIFLTVQAPDEVELESRFVVRVTLHNLQPVETGPLLIRLSERFFEWFALLEVYPQPYDMFVRGAGRYFSIDSIPGNSEMLVTFRFKPTEAGRYPLKVTVVSSENAVYVGHELKIDVI